MGLLWNERANELWQNYGGSSLEDGALLFPTRFVPGPTLGPPGGLVQLRILLVSDEFHEVIEHLHFNKICIN